MISITLLSIFSFHSLITIKRDEEPMMIFSCSFCIDLHSTCQESNYLIGEAMIEKSEQKVFIDVNAIMQ